MPFATVSSNSNISLALKQRQNFNMEPSLIPASANNLRPKSTRSARNFPAWTSFFIVNLLIGYGCYFAGVDLIHQLRSAARDRTDSDLSDLLVKFSVIYLLTRNQLLLRTWSDSTTGLTLAWIVSTLVNLIVGDLLTGLVWRPFGRLLVTGCQWLSGCIMRNYPPTHVAMGLSSWLQLMAGGHIKYAMAYYLLYRSVRSLLKEEPKATVVATAAAILTVGNGQPTYSPLPAIGLQQEAARSRTRSRTRSRRR